MGKEINRMFSVGREFPGKYATNRLEEIKENCMLYNGLQRIVYLPDLLRRLDLAGVVHTEYSSEGSRRVTSASQSEKYKSVFVSINAHAPVIQTYANLLFGEGIDIIDKDEQRNLWLNGEKKDEGWLYNQSFVSKMLKAVVGAGKRGNGVLKVWQDEGKAMLSVIEAEYWFPIASDADKNYIVADVIANEIEIESKDKSENIKILRVEIYEVGKNTYKLLKMDGCKIVSQIEWTDDMENIVGGRPEGAIVGENGLDLVEDTGYSYSMLQSFPFMERDDSIFGAALYTEATKTLERDLCIRKTHIGRIEDKNSDPGMYGPGANVTTDPMTGATVVESQGKYIVTSKEDVVPGYLEFGGNLEKDFTTIKTTREDFYEQTGTNGAILAATTEGVGIMSGTAFEKVYAPTLSRVSPMKIIIEPVIDRILKLAYEIENGQDALVPEPTWFDGLPKSKKENIEDILLQNGSKPVMSHSESIQISRAKSKEDADLIVTEIEEEEKRMNASASAFPPFGVE